MKEILAAMVTVLMSSSLFNPQTGMLVDVVTYGFLANLCPLGLLWLISVFCAFTDRVFMLTSHLLMKDLSFHIFFIIIKFLASWLGILSLSTTLILPKPLPDNFLYPDASLSTFPYHFSLSLSSIIPLSHLCLSPLSTHCSVECYKYSVICGLTTLCLI